MGTIFPDPCREPSTMTIALDNLEIKYNELFELLEDRKQQVIKFKEYIESETSWLTSPASTRFHLNIERGLLLHSVGVTYNALRIKNLIARHIRRIDCCYSAFSRFRQGWIPWKGRGSGLDNLLKLYKISHKYPLVLGLYRSI